MTSETVLRNSENVGLPLVITDVGRAAAVNAAADGLALTISEIAVGDGLWSPDATATELQSEIKRLDNIGGAEVAPDQIHITITDDSTDAYTVGEFGLYTDSGLLFAIYSRPVGVIGEKIDQSVLMMSADIKLDSIPPRSVTVSGPGFMYPPATETVAGVAEIATTEEVVAGTDAERIVTPATLKTISDTKKTIYRTEIDLTGLPTDVYYPVWWNFPDRTIGRMEIYRHFYRDEELDPFGDGDQHIAHLALEMEGSGHIWAGESNFLDIKRLGWRYRPTVRAIHFGAKCTIHQLDDLPIYGGYAEGDVVGSWVHSGCYLRGGLSYTVTSDFEGIYYSRDENPVEMYRQKHSGGTGFILRTQPRKIDDAFLGGDILAITTTPKILNIRFGAVESRGIYNAPGFGDQLGYVTTGVRNFDSSSGPDTTYRRPLQAQLIDGSWVNVGA